MYCAVLNEIKLNTPILYYTITIVLTLTVTLALATAAATTTFFTAAMRIPDAGLVHKAFFGASAQSPDIL